MKFAQPSIYAARLIVVALVFAYPITCCAHQKIVTQNDTTIVRSDLKKHFESCGVKGSIVLYDRDKQQIISSDTIASVKETLPASTFKIINLLIALETKIISNEKEVIKWKGKIDTLKYGNRPEIYHDMTVEKAFKISAGWVFVALAEKIGRERYKEYLSLCNYGNNNLTQSDTDFWNFGAFGISPFNQVNFLRKFYEGTLPFSKENIAIVKNMMISEQNNAYTIRAKTGWTRDTIANTGWWVGYVETKGGVYFFATRIIQDNDLLSSNFGNCRKKITKRILLELGII